MYGICLEEGKGVETDDAKALRFFKMSADQGNKDGQLRYGRCLLRTPQDDNDLATGASYLKLSADQGNKEAQTFYGLCLGSGYGVSQDLAAADNYIEMSRYPGSVAARCWNQVRLPSTGEAEEETRTRVRTTIRQFMRKVGFL
jgi:hypothetical protein